MPFAAPFNFDDENDPKKQNGGVNVSGQSTNFATNVPGQESSQSSGNQKSSGQYANIQSYLDANKTQADEMGKKITDNVGAKAEDASQKINSFQSNAPQVQAYDPSKVLNDPTKASDEDKANYKVQRATGGYSGPQSLEQANGYQETQKAGQDAIQDVKNAGTEYGQQALLKKTYDRPQYTAGENRLDQALLQNSAGSRSNLESLSQRYSGLENMLNSATTNVGNAINQANTQALANKNAIGSAEQQTIQNLMNPIKARADQANANNSAYADRIMADAGDDTLSDETLAALGLSPGSKLYDMNIANYITPDKSQVGINNVATADERAKYAALASLMEDPSMSQLTTDGKVINPVSFNKDQFDKDFAAKDAEYTNAYENKNSQTVLDNKFFPGVGDNNAWQSVYSQYTPKQLETQILPQLKNEALTANGESYRATAAKLASYIEGSLNNWKSKFQSNRTIKKG